MPELKACLFVTCGSGLCWVKFLISPKIDTSNYFWYLLWYVTSSMVKNIYSYIELEFLTFQFLSSAMYPSTAHLQKKSGAIFAKNIYTRSLPVHWPLKSGLHIKFTGQWRSTQLKVRQNEKNRAVCKTAYPRYAYKLCQWLYLLQDLPSPPSRVEHGICKTGVSHVTRTLRADGLLHQQQKNKCSHHDWHIRDFLLLLFGIAPFFHLFTLSTEFL